MSVFKISLRIIDCVIVTLNKNTSKVNELTSDLLLPVINIITKGQNKIIKLFSSVKFFHWLIMFRKFITNYLYTNGFMYHSNYRARQIIEWLLRVFCIIISPCKSLKIFWFQTYEWLIYVYNLLWFVTNDCHVDFKARSMNGKKCYHVLNFLTINFVSKHFKHWNERCILNIDFDSVYCWD